MTTAALTTTERLRRAAELLKARERMKELCLVRVVYRDGPGATRRHELKWICPGCGELVRLALLDGHDLQVLDTAIASVLDDPTCPKCHEGMRA